MKKLENTIPIKDIIIDEQQIEQECDDNSQVIENQNNKNNGNKFQATENFNNVYFKDVKQEKQSNNQSFRSNTSKNNHLTVKTADLYNRQRGQTYNISNSIKETHPYQLKQKDFFKRSNVNTRKVRPETPTYQGRDYGFSDKKISIRQLGYSSNKQQVFYADNLDSGDVQGEYKGEDLNITKFLHKNWLVVYGLEQPKLIKKICAQYIDINNEQKDEMLNGWVADFVETNSNPTLNDIDEKQLYLVIKYIYFNKNSDNCIIIKHFSFVVGQNYLLTFLEQGDEYNNGRLTKTTFDFQNYIEELISRVAAKDSKYINSEIYFILFKLIDKVVENYKFVIKQFVESIIDPLETEVVGKPSIETLKKIHMAKTEMLEIKYATRPLQQMLKRILKRKSFYNSYKQMQRNYSQTSVPPSQFGDDLYKNFDSSDDDQPQNSNNNLETQSYNYNMQQLPVHGNYSKISLSSQITKFQGQFIKMIFDEIMEVNNDVNQSLELIQNQLNIYLSNASNNMADQSQKTNEIMKFLTLVTSVFIPLSFLTGLYGMNFEHMPELQYEFGYYILLSAMFCIATSMVLYFKKKKWIAIEY